MDLTHKRVAITGRLSRPRKEVAAVLEQAGATVVSDVSARTDLLLVGEKPGSKLGRANDLGIPVVTEAELDGLLAADSPPSLGTAGGPALVVPAELSPLWEGSFQPSAGRVVEAEARWDSPERPATDYDRALDAVSWEYGFAGLPLGDGHALVCRDEFVEVLERDGTTVLHSTAVDVLDRVRAEQGETMWQHTAHALPLPSGRLLLLDAAAPGAESSGHAFVGPRVSLQLEPGLYAVDRACHYWADRNEELRAARLRKVGATSASTVSSTHRALAIAARREFHHRCKERGVKDAWRLGGLIRDRVRIRVQKPAPAKARELGATRFGGSADLPSEEAWPMAPGVDFAFLCQIDLRDLSPFDVGHRLPDSGLLSFFVGSPAVIGMRTEHEVVARVLYTPAGAELHPFWRSWGTPRMRGMAFELAPTPPPWNSQLVGHDDPAYCALYDELEREPPSAPGTALFGFDRVYEEALAPTEEMLLCCWVNEDIDYPFVETVTLCVAIDRGALFRRDFSQVRCWEGPTI